jgi:hypothetical protein
MKFDSKKVNRLLGEMESVLVRVKKINDDFQAKLAARKTESKKAA